MAVIGLNHCCIPILLQHTGYHFLSIYASIIRICILMIYVAMYFNYLILIISFRVLLLFPLSSSNKFISGDNESSSDSSSEDQRIS